MAGSPLVGAPGSRFRAINVYETRSRFDQRVANAIREIAQFEDRPPGVVVRRLALAGLQARCGAVASRQAPVATVETP